MKLGDLCYLVYDARPVVPVVKIYRAHVVKVTPTGRLRIETFAKDKSGQPVYNELFDDNGNWGVPRGWNTLKWQTFIPGNRHNIPVEIYDEETVPA